MSKQVINYPRATFPDQTLKPKSWGDFYVSFPHRIKQQDLNWHGLSEYIISSALKSAEAAVRLKRLDNPNFSQSVEDQDPFIRNEKGGVECDESKMEVHRPYPYKIGEFWFVAVRHSKKEGHVGIYVLEE